MNGVLKNRDLQPELMDDPKLSPELHDQALEGLRRINRLSSGSASMFRELRRHYKRLQRPLKLLDIACGGGDSVVRMARLAETQKLPFQVEGCDISGHALTNAENLAARHNLVNTRFFQRDVLRHGVPEGYDMVTCSLFLHHLTATDATDLIRNMASACRRSIQIDDLKRSIVGYWLAKAGCHLLSSSPIVRFDGPQSVRAAFTLDEIRDMANTSGLAKFSLTSRWPQRWTLKWTKPCQ